jgi:predicted nucleic acid-binding protein
MTIEMRYAVDTNILAYADGVDGQMLSDRAFGILNQLSSHEMLLPVQVLGELFRVLRKKGLKSPFERDLAIRRWIKMSVLIETDLAIFEDALLLTHDHQFDIWDAVILSASASARCQILLTEDMKDGFVWRGTTVCNPFAEKLHPLLASVLED